MSETVEALLERILSLPEPERREICERIGDSFAQSPEDWPSEEERNQARKATVKLKSLAGSLRNQPPLSIKRDGRTIEF